MFVVFDTNVWLAELGLRSGAAAATKFYLRQTGATVVIPEVIRLEAEHHLARRLTDFAEEIRANHRQLLTAFGTLREVVLPTADDIRQKVAEVFDSLDVTKRDVPFGLESARSSLLKTITKLPPSDKTQEFKDGVIWADCLALAREDDVVLVTIDKAFYKDRTYEKGLADNLRSELARLAHSVHVLQSLPDLLGSIRRPIELDTERLLAACINAEPASIQKTLDNNGFVIAGEKIPRYRLFATEDPNKLFFEYTFRLRCDDITDQGRTDAHIVLKGDGTYDPSTGAFATLRNFGEHLTFTKADGTPGEVRHAVLFGANIVLGHREVSSVVRYALGE
jgi:predicted nucleic acid-binding protein